MAGRKLSNVFLVENIGKLLKVEGNLMLRI
jgi:hypothetical protein